MCRGWKPTGLRIGEDISLPDEFFELPKVARRRILYSRYVGETETGLIIEIQYDKGFCSEDPMSSWRVQKFVAFADIWCGAVTLMRSDHTRVMVERQQPHEMQRF